MYEKQMLVCPACGAENPLQLEQRDQFTCLHCNSRFNVLTDEATGEIALANAKEEDLPEPLFLPKGSIRAGVALLLAFCCWVIACLPWELPDYLLSLLLTIVGYYFAYRGSARIAHGRFFDPRRKPEEPLFLPPGAVRKILIAGFLVAAVALAVRGKLGEVKHLQFFIILLGLAVGFLFARLLSAYKSERFCLALNHVKGALVLGVAVYLAVILLTGLYREHTGRAELTDVLLCAVISFYYGSRT